MNHNMYLIFSEFIIITKKKKDFCLVRKQIKRVNKCIRACSMHACNVLGDGGNIQTPNKILFTIKKHRASTAYIW